MTTPGAGEAEILRVHEALEELAQFDARMVQVVEMRYFAGMTEIEIAEALGVTRSHRQARLGKGAAPAGGGAPVAAAACESEPQTESD